MSSKRSSNSSGSGLLSGVFSIVSREFESFVANATGSSSAAPSSSRVLLEDDSPESDHRSRRARRKQSPVEWDEEDSPPRKPATRSKQSQRNRTHERKPSRRSPSPAEILSEEDSSDDGSSRRSPTPPRLPRALKRRPSISMPGSLFPRSPSMEPGTPQPPEHRGHHVRFHSPVVPSPQSPPPKKPRTRESSNSKRRSLLSDSESPRRTPGLSSSVKAVVDKFHIGPDDADPSILLPSPKKSPHALTKTQHSRRENPTSPSPSSSGKGKEREVRPSVEDEVEYLGIKSKEKELSTAREELDKNEQRSDGPAPDRAERDRERDQERIRMLEEEIARLKQELSRRPSSWAESSGASHPPPPPPPPPPPSMMTILSAPTSDSSNVFASARASLKQAPVPVENPINPLGPGRRPGQPTIGLAPDKMAAFLKEMKTVRLRKVSQPPELSSSHPGGSSSSFSADRSFIQPSLRHRSSSFNRFNPNMSAPNLTVPPSVFPRREMDPQIGEKRKRTITGDLQVPLKRRTEAPSASSGISINSTASSSRSLLPSEPISAPPSSRPYSSSARPSSSSQSWQTSSVTDAPTPSLCSDNDVEREGDASPDDHVPSTPPAPAGPSRAIYRFRGNGIPVETSLERDFGDTTNDHDADMVMDESETQAQTQETDSSFIRSSLQQPRTNMFDKRPPSSPFPNKSPRRPRPPARTSRTVPALPTPPRPRRTDHSDDEDPLSLSFSSPENAAPLFNIKMVPTKSGGDRALARGRSTRSPSAAASRHPPKSRHRSASQVSRRRTLDEELRNAFEEGDSDDDDGDAVLVGVGTRSKRRGFLAHGGAGGDPVFMGVGYVEGAEEDTGHDPGGDDDDEYLPPSSQARARWR